MAVIVIFIHIQKPIFVKRFYIHKKQKKSILFTYGIPRALLSNKMVFLFLQKVNNSIATKLCMNLINTCVIFLKKMVNDTIQ